MSGLVDQILQAGGGQAVEMIAGRFGLSPSQSQSAIEALAPMIAGGFKNQASQGGLESILGGVLNQDHVQVGADPNQLAKPGTTDAGNQILSQIFGSKDVSRQVATQAADQTGISSDILKQMLPVIAMMAAGAMANKANSGGLGGLLGSVMGGQQGGMLGNILGSVMGGTQNGSQGGNLLESVLSGALGNNAQGAQGALGSIASMLDMDKDGNPLNDIMGMLGKK